LQTTIFLFVIYLFIFVPLQPTRQLTCPQSSIGSVLKNEQKKKEGSRDFPLEKHKTKKTVVNKKERAVSDA